ncbi:PGF-pre-PGF domain-containing protein [Methanofollis formosanus]|uniref:PGF-pre-PGF domain-containing protein n=1 Tax=Methanofollis formosanus TaxID=299308 RepID=A0A8G1A1T9_9EURY|nr:lectin like domain-containing protein [Methanofollis formosanus]QYZ78858.1 PGF-pre-PGF domain-containing protein [Methanofollis formosanus]
MNTSILKGLAGALLCACLLLWAAAPAASALEVTEAPLNPEFVKYLEEQEAPADRMMTAAAASIEEGESTDEICGEIPSPVTVAWPEGSEVQTTSAFKPAPSESRYDLRDEGRVGSVKDQGHCGSCWSFAAIGSLESTLLPGEVWDFSENNLKNTHGLDYTHVEGGNAYMATAYFSRWSGPVNESDDPYSEVSGVSPTGLTVRKHVQDVDFLPVRKDRSNVTLIKQAVKEYGGVYSSMYWSNGFYDEGHASYYDPWLVGGGHAVLIVGWDDTYSKENFTFTPPGDGAFIVRNSWNTDWGDDGYFYQSYYDADRGCKAVFTAEDTDNYRDVYFHDPLGWTSAVGLGSETAYAANVFTATSGNSLGAVGFFTPAPNAAYEVSVYVDPTDGPLSADGPVTTISGTQVLPGYHTHPLATPVPLKPGQKFSVVVKLTTPGYYQPLAVEKPIAGFSTGAKASAGESYVSADGVEWDDLTTRMPNTNVCLKAYSVYEEPKLSFSTAHSSVNAGDETEVPITMSRAPWGLAGYEIDVSVADPEVATITGASYPAWATLNLSRETDDGLMMRAVDLDDAVHAGDENVALGTVRVKGLIGGASDLEIAVRQIDADGGDLVTTTANTSSVTVAPAGDREQAEKAKLDVPGCTFAGRNVSVKNSGDVQVSGDRKSIKVSGNSFDLTIRTTGEVTEEDGIFNGTVERVVLQTRALAVRSEGAGEVRGSVMADLTGVPQGAAVTTALRNEAGAGTMDIFERAAGEEGLTIDAFAASLEVRTANLNDGEEITGATVLMSAPTAWVEAHGGAENVTVIRCNDGKATLLQTRVQVTEGGMTTFAATSPDGFCEFGLVAVSAAPVEPTPVPTTEPTPVPTTTEPTPAPTTTEPAHVSSQSSGGSSQSDTAVGAADSLRAGENVTLTMRTTPVTAVTLRTKEDIDGLMLSVKKATLPSAADAPEDAVYAYVEATLYRTTEDRLSGETIAFAVPTAWMKAHSCTADDIGLFRYVDGAWKPLETVFTGENGGIAYFAAESDGFSTFAIAATAGTPETPAPTVTSASAESGAVTPAETDTVPATTTQKSPLPLWAAALAIGSAALLARRH